MRWVWLGALVLLVAACSSDSEGDGISIDDVWALSTPPGVADAAVYFTVQAPEDDVLVGGLVAADVAASVELHETTHDHGSMTMEGTPAVALPAGEEVAFEAGERHLMLADLAAPLTDGDTFELTLEFERADPLTVTVDVRHDAP